MPRRSSANCAARASMAFQDRLDPSQTVIDLDHLADQRFETGFQIVEAVIDAGEAVIDAVEPGVHVRFEAGKTGVHIPFETGKTRGGGTMLENPCDEGDQDCEGWNA